MSPGRRDEDDADTPPTRTYVDALLNQSLSAAQLANLRAEIVTHDGELPDDDDDEGRTSFHTYSEAERFLARPPDDDDDDGGRTAFHSYSEAERQSARPFPRVPTPKPPAQPAVDDDDDDGARTRFHSYSEAERSSARPAPDGDDDDDGARTRFHSYSEAERRSARPPAEDDDDARTLFRPPSRQPPMMPPSAPRTSDRAPPRSAQPVSSVPPRSAQPASSDRIPLTARPASSDRIPLTARSSSSDRLPRAPVVTEADAPGSARTPPPVELELPPSVRAPMPTIDLDVPLSLPTPPPYEHEPVPLSAPTPGRLDTRAIDKTYLDAIGGPGGVPRLAVSPAKLTTLSLQPQAGFLVGMIDGQSTVDDLIDISGLSRLETLRILYHLVQQGVISVNKR